MTNFEKELAEFFVSNNQTTVLVIVYKIVRCVRLNNDIEYYSKMAEELSDSELICKYELGKTTFPKVGGLFAFRKEIIDDTYHYLKYEKTSYHQILKCVATINRRQVNNHILNLIRKRTKKCVSSFWRNVDKKENYNYMNGRKKYSWTVPDYTIICSSITPIELYDA